MNDLKIRISKITLSYIINELTDASEEGESVCAQGFHGFFEERP